MNGIGVLLGPKYADIIGNFSEILQIIPILLIGLGVDFGIHFGMRYAELVREEHAPAEALAQASGSVGGSIVLCAFTTAVGFFVFVPTDYKAVGELGLISGTGLLLSLFCSLTVLPAFLSVWHEHRPKTSWKGALWFERVVITASSSCPM